MKTHKVPEPFENVFEWTESTQNMGFLLIRQNFSQETRNFNLKVKMVEKKRLKTNEEEKKKKKLSPEEKMKLEIKKLERENERLRAENLFLKKLEEIERRRK